MYTEADAKKGANEVVSFLNHFLQNFVGEGKTQLKIFSDGCVGQHKNLTILRNYHVHIQSGRFNKIVHRYPVTSHSYLPCDQKFTVIEKIKRTQQTVETPQEWLSLVKNRTKFHVIHVTQDMIFDYQQHYAPFFRPVAMNSREKLLVSKVKVAEFAKNHKQEVIVSRTMSGADKVPFRLAKSDGYISFPSEPLYNGPISLAPPKVRDVRSLFKYLSPDSVAYYEGIFGQGDESV